MKYTSINIQGNLISEEILQKIEEADVQGQLAKDFGFEPGINLRSEIEYAWSRIKLDWKHFSERIEKLPPSDPYGTTLARKWMVGFFNTLGFEIFLQKTSLQGDNKQQYTISHTCNQLDGLPVHIAGFYDQNHPQKNTLDIRSSGGTTRMSPHATIQEYLNVTEHLYGMVANGMLLRLVRDSGRLVKLTYIEFDLKRLLDEDKYSEFTLLYRLLHASRFPKTKQETEESLLEKYYQDSIESGNRIRDGLSSAVKESLIALGNGLIEHPENGELRERVSSGRPDPRDFYHQLLRLIYRLLFLMVTEERDLIFAEIRDENLEPDLDDLLSGIKRPTKKQKEIYYQYYSLIRLRKLSEKRYLQENQYTDLWQGLLQTFALFESGGTGNKLGILALGSELFSGNAMPDITSSKLNNKVLLQCIRSLNEFEDAKHNLSFINYRALDVEELGSVYEGLLELEPVFETENGKPKFSFKKGSERSSSGSHYTPEDLVKPLIKHSLEYLIEEKTADFYKEKTSVAETKQKLLDLKVCDVACGSGHILLSAARRIAIEVARVETGEQQPNPTSFRHALKEVIRNCIYGVDKNPQAVELCKVALWLESHNPGEPLNFLDHRIKCGDAIVGLAHREELQNGIANEAYKKLPGDDKEIISAFAKKNKQERNLREKSRQAVQLTTETDHKLMQQVKELNAAIDNFSKLPENTPDEIEQKEQAYLKLINNETLRRLKTLADLQVMPFFLEKIERNKEYLITDAQYHRYLRGELKTPFALEVKAVEYATINRFFHWFLEFPEVFQKGGFSCILGNPPFLGGSKITGNFSDSYFNYLKMQYFPAGGLCDMVGYFFRRNYDLITLSGFISLISTNTISQGDTRSGSLEIIEKNDGHINHVIRSIKWPGIANLYVSLISISKGISSYTRYIDGKKVSFISTNFDDINAVNPFVLKQNQGLIYLGCKFLGEGFIIEKNKYEKFIETDIRNKKVLFPLINGKDVNDSPSYNPNRFIINFFNWDLKKASTFKDLFRIVEEKVKPERLLNNDKLARERWWNYLRPRRELYSKIETNEFCFVIAKVTKYLALTQAPTNVVYTDNVFVLVEPSFYLFTILSSTIFDIWVRKHSSSLANTLNFAPTDCFETFPIPQNLSSEKKQNLAITGKTYHDFRKLIMSSMQLGITKTYNCFHANAISSKISQISEISNMKKDQIAELFGKEGYYLFNHLSNTNISCSFNEAIDNIEKLREMRVLLDKEVLNAYDWQDIDLNHDFYELEFLPENDRIRFTIHPDARREILKRLSDTNHKIHEEEVKAGLWDKKVGNKRTSKSKTNTNQVNEGEVRYGGLFG